MMMHGDDSHDVPAASGWGSPVRGPRQHPSDEALFDLVQEGLAGAERARVETHVAACGRCSALVLDAGAGRRLMAGQSEPMPQPASRALHARLGLDPGLDPNSDIRVEPGSPDAEAPAQRMHAQPRGRRRWLVPAVALATVAVIAGVGTFAVDPQDASVGRSATPARPNDGASPDGRTDGATNFQAQSSPNGEARNGKAASAAASDEAAASAAAGSSSRSSDAAEPESLESSIEDGGGSTPSDAGSGAGSGVPLPEVPVDGAATGTSGTDMSLSVPPPSTCTASFGQPEPMFEDGRPVTSTAELGAGIVLACG